MEPMLSPDVAALEVQKKKGGRPPSKNPPQETLKRRKRKEKQQAREDANAPSVAKILQTEATTHSAQVALLQRDTTGLTAENKELKMQLQAMEQQAQLREGMVLLHQGKHLGAL
ncbi:transcription factor RF2b-like [Humulus lupulus]|uniref:transcription factor RF2b-like n=1 Tax=Humulus lupulus TaxID=3486 RepID=UPI002B40E28A|nr:transcription factor RF2b-like [Humulus lupulus]